MASAKAYAQLMLENKQIRQLPDFDSFVNQQFSQTNREDAS